MLAKMNPNPNPKLTNPNPKPNPKVTISVYVAGFVYLLLLSQQRNHAVTQCKKSESLTIM